MLTFGTVKWKVHQNGILSEPITSFITTNRTVYPYAFGTNGNHLLSMLELKSL